MHHNKLSLALAKPIILGSMLALSSMFSSHALSATPNGTQFTNSQLVKLARIKSKNRQSIDLDSYIKSGDAVENAFNENNAECGNVEIGNIEKPRIGQTIKPVDVIIVGDVINVPDGC